MSAVHSGKCLDVGGASTSNGAALTHGIGWPAQTNNGSSLENDNKD